MDTEGKFMDMEEYEAISAKAAQPQKVMEEEKSESRRRELLQSLESTRLTQTLRETLADQREEESRGVAASGVV
ncbi:uncharacterized protein FRV6_00233 [Fusarium oxysporum]|uniref:Uncharacterized protein n=1 Tax=Fusarium oxysporum TaxID=5507 RepID=A0A2H3SIS9_FUSOX|nr:uncharacterized protein FRV6_00233 [Fusarium oxysporum]